MTINQSEILLKKYIKLDLGHFYLISPPYGIINRRDFLHQWINNLLSNILNIKKTFYTINKNQGPIIYDHSDILTIDPIKQTYTEEDLISFFKFLSFRPLELTWRFIIFTDVHKLTKNISNKLLKSLEEPQAKTTIFFLNPYKQSLLTTIESRAIKFSLQNVPEQITISQNNFNYKSINDIINELNSNECYNYLNNSLKENLKFYLQGKISEIEFIDLTKKDNEASSNLALFAISVYSNCDFSHEKLNIFLSELKWFTNAASYNNPKAERIFALLHMLSNTVASVRD